MNYQETLHYLFDALPMFHRVGPAAYKANLDNTHALCDLLDHPEKELRCIHVAGTNGKGSVSHMLASILQEAGYKTGLYTSPHLKDFRERIRINGQLISADWVAHFVTAYQKDFERISPSFFEMSTLMAFAAFREMACDICVIETGLGGRLDSTNVIDPLISVITNIGYDHMNLLGDSLEKIAVEKAGIIKPLKPVIIGKTQTETKAVFLQKAHACSSPIFFADQEFSLSQVDYNPLAEEQTLQVVQLKTGNVRQLVCDLTGSYQAQNCATVLQAMEVLKDLLTIQENHLELGLKRVKANTGLQGRWQILSRNPIVLCDTGHNEDGLREVLPKLKAFAAKKTHIVLGMVNDKEIAKVLRMFPTDAEYYFCKAAIPRGLEAELLQAEATLAGLQGECYPSVAAALQGARKKAGPDDLIFVGGSTFTVAEVV